MSVRLGDGTDLGEASLFGFTNMPSLLGGVNGVKDPGGGGGGTNSCLKR
jgi:hypothetical protein